MGANSVKYNYPKLASKEIHSVSSGNIQYYLIGKENEPNVILSKKNTSSKYSYVSSKLYIYSEDTNKGTLIIENVPITNIDKKLFLTVPLITPNSNANPHILDNLIQDNLISDDLELNTCLPDTSSAKFYETRRAIVIELDTPIVIQSYLTGLSKYTSSIPDFPNVFDNRYDKTDPQPISVEKTAISKSSIINYESTKPVQEGFVEGATTMGVVGSDNNYTWMECDAVPLDYSNEVPTYTASNGSTISNSGTGFIVAALATLWILIGLILCFFYVPFFYKTFLDILFKNTSQDTSQFAEMAIIAVLCIVGISLLIDGGIKVSKSGNLSTASNDMSELIAGASILGGVILSFVVVRYFTSVDYYLPNVMDGYWIIRGTPI